MWSKSLIYAFFSLLLFLEGHFSMAMQQVPTMQDKPKIEQLPPDLQRYLLPFLTSDDVQSTAKTIQSLNLTDKFFHNLINNPVNMRIFLESIPYTAHAIDLVTRLKNMPVMQTATIQEWVKQAKNQLVSGQELANAAAMGNVEEVKKLLSNHKINLNFQTNSGSTPLTIALMNENAQIANLLLDKGANPNLFYKGGPSLLITIGKIGRTPDGYDQKLENDIMKKLLARGANPNMVNNSGRTALMHAAQLNNKDILKILLQAGSDVNLQDEQGFTALMYAAMQNNADIVKVLLDNKANLNLKNSSKQTAADFAASAGADSVIRIFDEYVKK